MTTTVRYGYIGVAPECGCIRAFIADDPRQAVQVARDVAGFVRSGLTVERRLIETVRATRWTDPACATHGRKPQPADTEHQEALL